VRQADPWQTLGLSAGASPEDIARAYREAAKRHHPDRAGDDGERMKEINAAYALLLARENPGRAGGAGAGAGGTSRTEPYDPPPGTRSAGMPAPWLAPDIRRALGSELLRHLAAREPVLAIADAVTWDSHAVRLAATDRRLIWLRDDVPVERVRALPYALVRDVESRERGRRRRSGELRVHRVDRRRPVVFAEMDPVALAALVRALPHPS
jgi:hypothetical protein